LKTRLVFRSIAMGWLAALCAVVPGEGLAQKIKDDRSLVIYTLAYVEQCTWVDQLLRTTCERIGQHLSQANRKYCKLPDDTFEAHNAGALLDFRARHDEEILNNSMIIASIVDDTRGDLERQFAEVLAGKVSMFHLETMHRVISGECLQIEQNWLPMHRRPGS